MDKDKLIKEIIEFKFDNINKKVIRQALIEYYSQRTPINLHIPYIKLNIPINVVDKEVVYKDKVVEKVIDRIIYVDREVEKKVNVGKYDYIKKEEDKRIRKSKAWQIYKKLCEDKEIEPKVYYPAGTYQDYIRFALELERS